MLRDIMLNINSIDSTESEDLIHDINPNYREVSFGSIKTQDSIENKSVILDFDEEEYKETNTSELQITEMRERHQYLQPFMSLREAQLEIANAVGFPRKKLEIKHLDQVIQRIQKISEDFQTWRKIDQ